MWERMMAVSLSCQIYVDLFFADLFCGEFFSASWLPQQSCSPKIGSFKMLNDQTIQFESGWAIQFFLLESAWTAACLGFFYIEASTSGMSKIALIWSRALQCLPNSA